MFETEHMELRKKYPLSQMYGALQVPAGYCYLFPKSQEENKKNNQSKSRFTIFFIRIFLIFRVPVLHL